MDKKMKISCLPVSLFPMLADGSLTLKEMGAKMKEIGYDAMDVSIFHLKDNLPNNVKKIKDDLAEIDFSIYMCCSYPDFTNPDAMQRRRELDYLRRDIAFCSELGIPTIRVLAGQGHDIKREDGIKWAVENLVKAQKAAEYYGVTLLFEDHGKPTAWENPDFTFIPENFLAIAKELRGTGVKINFDTGNPLSYGVDPLPMLKEVVNEVGAIHVLDMAEKGKVGPCLTGTGAVNFEEIFKYLKEVKWDGWLCIEEIGHMGWEGVEKSYKYVRETWDKM